MFLILCLNAAAQAEEKNGAPPLQYGDENDPFEDQTVDEADPSDPAPVLAPAANRPFIIFNEGLTASWLTRIIKQTGRSNFVFKDFMPGLYFGMELTNIKLVTPTLRLAAYYPLTATFNRIPQQPKSPLHMAADFFAGPGFEFNMLKYVRFNFVPGLHFFYQHSDRWNYFNIGLAGLGGFELPLSRGWTILVNGMASIDNGNLGSNKDMEPFDIVYQYQVDLGVRYSKKAANAYPYIKPKPGAKPLFQFLNIFKKRSRS
ncbi:MAG: hypothetical protein LBG10_08890 [Treponema sp.]|nr:hypothetical protein [Treponema sp.]